MISAPNPSAHPPAAESARRLVVIVGVLLAVVTAADWFMRFRWFRWQDTLVTSKREHVVAGASTNAPAFSLKEIAPQRGGDLSRFLPKVPARARFEEERVGYTATVDPAGYDMPPYQPDTQFDYVVVGDSYMAAGGPLTNQMAYRLAERLGQPVLNRAIQGRGPFQAIFTLVGQYEAGETPPQWLVWGFIERELSGPAFSGFVYQLEDRRKRVMQAEASHRPPQSGLVWAQLRPSVLRASLPNTSAAAQLSRKVWNLFQYLIMGRPPSDVFIFERMDPPMLGYGFAMESMYWSPELRDIKQAAWAVRFIRDYLAALNIRLLVVTIPDKEQIYFDHIPRSAWRNGRPPLPTVVPEFNRLLAEQGISHVDLRADFMLARNLDQRLYWRDDTHWNPAGIARAADLIAAEIQRQETTAPKH